MDCIYKKLNKKRILITGGAGFIGGALIRRLLLQTNCQIFNIDKLSYCSDLSSINKICQNKKFAERYNFYKLDLSNNIETINIIGEINPDLVFHLAAESHVDNSITNPKTFINSNILGTFNLLEGVLKHFKKINTTRKNFFRFHHVSTDEVFGSLSKKGYFNENSNYDPRSPYSASKAASDHLVKSWHHTYDLPIVITNCSNNFGPWQYPEKLIPLVIHNALNDKNICVYGDGSNVRDWLYIEDHIDGILLAALNGDIGKKYCIGGYGEIRNIELVNMICNYLDKKIGKSNSYSNQIKFIKDRPGHDFRYSIDSSFIKKTLNWRPKCKLSISLEKTFQWYIDNQEWSKEILLKN